MSIKNWFITKIRTLLSLILNYSDTYVISTRFRNLFNRNIDLVNPSSFNEKLQYLKLYNRDNRLTVLADKYIVRNYVKSLGLGDYLNDLYDVFEDVNEIQLEELPESFVLKATHGSGWNIICSNKGSLDWDHSVQLMTQWLRKNFYFIHREWCYKNIKPRIIIERYLGHNLSDYKFFCFGGNPRCIQVDIDRFSNHRRNFYDLNWNKLSIQLIYENFEADLVSKPKKLDEMIRLSEILSAELPFARVDFYEVGNRVFFGEITLYPEAGFGKLCPEIVDYDWGNLIDIAPYQPSFTQKQVARAIMSVTRRKSDK